MLTKVKAYSSVKNAPTLLLDPSGSIFTDPLKIRNITGLEPVKATISTSAFAAIAGAAYVGSNIPTRNIVLTLHPNPDWVTWTVESLRKLIYLYFPTGKPVQLVFEDSVKPPVSIFGYVESVEPNPFAKDIEFPISILCPDPYFTAVDPVVVTGNTANSYTPETITYNGDVPAGIRVEVDFVTGQPAVSTVQIQTKDPSIESFSVSAELDSNQHLLMSSIPGGKFVDTIINDNGLAVSQLSFIADGYTWPMLEPGDNPFSVITDAGIHDWTLKYWERFGGL